MSSPGPAVPQSPPRRQRMLDGVAVTASVLCLVHCLALPLVLIAVPVLATMLAVPEAFHVIAFAFAVPTSILAMASGYRRHALRRPAAMAGVGLALLGLGAFGVDTEMAERIVTSIGAVILATAHILNWRALPACS